MLSNPGNGNGRFESDAGNQVTRALNRGNTPHMEGKNMGATGNIGTGGGTGAGTQGSEGGAESFSQEQVNAIVADRLSREREKYKDYNDLKNKAAEYDKQQEANKTELQKAQDRADALEKELSGLKAQEKVREIRTKVSSETGVPSELLTGSDEDACKAQAEAILKFAKGNKYPGIKETVNKKNTAGTGDNDNAFRELAGQLFGRKD